MPDSKVTYEGYGLPGMEACSAGCPLICSDIPTFREIYEDTAVFFKPGDYVDLANSILYFIKNLLRRNQIEKRALKYVKENFSWKKNILKYKEIYEKLIEANLLC